MRAISSWMMTVLPRPAPPNRPVLPPRTNGRQQVDDLDAGLEDLGLGRQVGERAAARGGWAGARSALTGPRPSIGSPSRLKTRPSVSLPTGTVTGRAGVDARPCRGPGRRSSPGRRARTRPPPRCCCDLADQRVRSSAEHLALDVDLAGRCRCAGRWSSAELRVEGRADDLGDACRRSCRCVVMRACRGVVAVHGERSSLRQRVGAADDLEQLHGDLRLAGAVVLARRAS